jgi:hypothetical protein
MMIKLDYSVSRTRLEFSIICVVFEILEPRC